MRGTSYGLTGGRSVRGCDQASDNLTPPIGETDHTLRFVLRTAHGSFIGKSQRSTCQAPLGLTCTGIRLGGFLNEGYVTATGHFLGRASIFRYATWKLISVFFLTSEEVTGVEEGNVIGAFVELLESALSEGMVRSTLVLR